MVIHKLVIRSFGKIQNQTLELSEGINVLYGKNESGKTTFYYFLKSMFYGLRRKRGKGAAQDTYTRFEPWEGATWYGGILWFEQKSEIYRLSRNFRREGTSFELFREGDPTGYGKEDLDRLLGGVGEAVYENTVSIGQLKSVTSQDLARELTDYMATSQGTGDCRLSLEKAGQLLKMERKGYADLKEKKERQNRQELEKLMDREQYVEKELEEIRDRLQEMTAKKEQIDALRASRQTAREEDPRIGLWEKQSGRFRFTGAGLVLAAMICFLLFIAILAQSPLDQTPFYQAIAGVLGRSGWLGLWAVLGCVLASAAMICFARASGINTRIERLERMIRKKKKRDKDRDVAAGKLEWALEGLRDQEKERLAALENLRGERGELEASLSLPLPEDEEIKAINLAMDKIRQSSQAIRSRTGSRLRERTGEILSQITDGKYRDVEVDEELNISIGLSDRTVLLDRLSRGTIEQVYFALRMASAEILCQGADFPVILDDVFGNYDEERLTAVLRWLAGSGRQVILCTCSRREAELLEQAGLSYSLVEMDVD